VGPAFVLFGECEEGERFTCRYYKLDCVMTRGGIMKKFALVVSILLFVGFFPGEVFADGSSMKTAQLLKKAFRVANITITILYDDYYFNHALKTGHGFSCLIETKGRKILFDTGGLGGRILDNFNKMNKNPKAIDIIVISHDHWDHTGGLRDLLEQGINPKIYVPELFRYDFKGKEKVVEVVRVGTSPMEISRGIFSTGAMVGEGREQALLINTNSGVVIITGCAHPGIIHVVKRAKEVLNRNIYLVLGGFHLLNEDENNLREMVAEFKKAGVQRVAPCHCSGKPVVFKSEFKENFIEAGVGKVIHIE
jgi:7,8-dihydropterin-6-yl-methyl-4-(beta-D-ribofuranosyl)aminobenzene 5'-phosphate synthase